MPSSKQALENEIEELQGTIDEAREVLEDVYTPEATRTDLVNAVSDVINLLAGEEEAKEGPTEEEEQD